MENDEGNAGTTKAIFKSLEKSVLNTLQSKFNRKDPTTTIKGITIFNKIVFKSFSNESFLWIIHLILIVFVIIYLIAWYLFQNHPKQNIELIFSRILIFWSTIKVELPFEPERKTKYFIISTWL